MAISIMRSRSPRLLARASLAALALLLGEPLVAHPAAGGAGELHIAAAGVTPQLVWARTFPGVGFRESSPVPATLGSPAYVVGARDGKVYAFDAATGADEPGWPAATTHPVESSPAAADVVGDGRSRIFVGSGESAMTVAGACSGGGTYAFEPTGATRWHNIGSDVVCPNQAFHSSFAVGDVTGDGLADATIGALGLQSPSYTAASGVMNAGWPFFTNDTVFSSPALADLQGTGRRVIVMGGDATPGAGSFQGGMMRAITGDGHLIWQFNTDEQVRSSPAVGDITGTGLSVVFGTGNFWLTHGGAKDSNSIFALDAAGHQRWRRDLGGVTQAAPALADVGGTGRPAVIEGTTGSPGNPNGGLVWVLDGAGNPLPNWAGRDSGGGVVIGGISTADLNGDGAQDLLVPTGAGVFLYDGRTAAAIGGLDIGQVGFQNTPLVTDDGGAVGITVAGTRPDGTGVVQHWRVAGGGAGVGAIGWPMFRHDATHTGTLGTAAVAGCSPQAAPTPPVGKVTRLAGADRDATAIAVSNASFPTTGSAKAVVLASDADFPDALAGGPLAVSKGGPLLITPRSGLTGAVASEIQRVLPAGATVFVLGGSLALATTIDAALTTAGFGVTRLAGDDRFGTAVAIAGALGNPATVFEVTGLNFADAVSSGPPAATGKAAILLTNGAAQSGATAAYLAASPRTRFAIGGPAAQADPSAQPIVGADRYATSVATAQRFFPVPTALGFATGTAFADALTGGPATARLGGPLLLVPPCGKVPAAVTAYATASRSGVTASPLFGGAHAVGDDVLSQLDIALA